MADPVAPSPSAPVGSDVPAYQLLRQMFVQFGLEQLGIEFEHLVSDPALTEAEVLNKVYDLPAYKARFPAMDYLRKTGGTWTEAQYLQQENAYKQVLKNNLMPAGFMDTTDEFANWIKGDVSPDELNKRLVQARRFVDSSDPTMLETAQRYYGLDRSTLVAYVADPQKASGLIDKQMRLMETGAAAARYGFQYDIGQAESLMNDPQAGALNGDQLRQGFSAARTLADQDARLSAIDQEAYSEQDAVDAVLKDNLARQQESRRRANREVGRFSGSNAGMGTLGRSLS